MFYEIGVLKYFAKFSGKHLLWSHQHRCFPVSFAKFFRIPFLQYTSKRLLLTCRGNSPIKKNLSDVLTIGCLFFLGNFPNKRLKLNLHFTLRLQFTFKCLKPQKERVLSQTVLTKPHTNFMHSFLSRHSRIVITNLFKNTLQRMSASMKRQLEMIS